MGKYDGGKHLRKTYPETVKKAQTGTPTEDQTPNKENIQHRKSFLRFSYAHVEIVVASFVVDCSLGS